MVACSANGIMKSYEESTWKRWLGKTKNRTDARNVITADQRERAAVATVVGSIRPAVIPTGTVRKNTGVHLTRHAHVNAMMVGSAPDVKCATQLATAVVLVILIQTLLMVFTTMSMTLENLNISNTLIQNGGTCVV